MLVEDKEEVVFVDNGSTMNLITVEYLSTNGVTEAQKPPSQEKVSAAATETEKRSIEITTVATTTIRIQAINPTRSSTKKCMGKREKIVGRKKFNKNVAENKEDKFCGGYLGTKSRSDRKNNCIRS